MTKSKRLHVIILVQNLPVPFDRRVWMEATTLQAAGYRVHVVSPNGEGFRQWRQTIDGIQVYRYPNLFESRSAWGFVLEYGWALLCLSVWTSIISLRFPIRLIQVCNPPDLLFLGAVPALVLRQARLIFDQHDLCPELLIAKGISTDNPILVLAKLAERTTYRLAKTVIAPNESFRSVAMKRGRKSPKDVFVVRSAPRRSFALSPHEITLSITDKGAPYSVGYLGIMGKQDGVDVLIRALGHLRRTQMKQVHLFLLGDGPERAFLEDLAVQEGLADTSHFLGYSTDETIREVLGKVDVCVAPDPPSQMNQFSSMNKLVEYMALARPVVQFDLLESRHTAGETALLVKDPTPTGLAHAISDLLDNPVQRQRMARDGHSKFMHELCWERQQEHLLMAYSHAALSG